MISREIRVLDTRRSRRCAICHDDVHASPSETCPGCRTVHHKTCRAELPRCPTLGCTVRAPDAPRFTLDDLELVHALGLAVVTSIALAVAAFTGSARTLVIVAVLHALVIPAAWAFHFRGRQRHAPSKLEALAILLELVLVPYAGLLCLGLMTAGVSAGVTSEHARFVWGAVALVSISLGPTANAWLVARVARR